VFQEGFTAEILEKLEGELENAFEIQFCFNKFALGEDFCRDYLGFTDEQLNPLRETPANRR